jgi:hypothetical protein
LGIGKKISNKEEKVLVKLRQSWNPQKQPKSKQ